MLALFHVEYLDIGVCGASLRIRYDLLSFCMFVLIVMAVMVVVMVIIMVVVMVVVMVIVMVIIMVVVMSFMTSHCLN